MFEELIFESIDPNILADMKSKLVAMYPQVCRATINSLLWYHTILLKTGGSNQWTSKRQFGELAVVPYHPLILEALKHRIQFRVAVTPEHLPPEFSDSSVQSGGENMTWTNVSILKFLHGLSGAHYKEPTSQTTVAIIACQEHQRSFKEATEEDEEIDEIFFNRKNEGFIIINGDLRKLYAMRPDALQEMTFAQFVISYYRKHSDQKALLNPQSNIGPESDEPIVGGFSRAPLFMKLTNNIIMKKRTDGSRPVPLLLMSNSVDLYEGRLLFQPWRNLDEVVGEVTEAELLQQKENRLALFPTSVFSKS